MENHIEPNEPRLLYRILAFPWRRQIDEGNGLQGLKCRALHFKCEIPSDLRQNDLKWGIENHIENNPNITPWISTSTNLSKLEQIIKKYGGRHLVVIDPNLLDTEIIDLTKQQVKDEVLRSEKSHNYAKYSDEVLIYKHVPIKAIISSRQYFLSNNGIDFKEIPNLQYEFPKKRSIV